ncbi:MAG: family 16 glycosylhydrolase [Verrucomicrobiota bacterium]
MKLKYLKNLVVPQRSLKLLAACLFGSLLSNSAHAGPPPAPAGYQWEPVWALTDEFNDNSINGNKWLKYNPKWVGRSPGRFKESQVSESGGYLRLKNTKVADTSQEVWVHTGFLASKTHNFVAGYYSECRLMAAKDGTVTGFWMSGTGTEIDVQEAVGFPANGNNNLPFRMRMNTHSTVNGDWATDIATPRDHIISTAVGDAFHTYGVWWKDNRNINFYYNGNYVTSVVSGRPFNVPMQLNINTETQNWIGDPTPWRLNNNNLNTTLVDFVRTWKLVPVGGAPIGKTISLKAVANNKFVASDSGLNATQWPLAANRTAVGAWEKFRVVDAGGGYVYLVANGNNKYVYSNGSIGTWPLIAASTVTGSWGKYKWVNNSDGTISLQCIANGKYVCADVGADPTNARLLTNRTAIGAWEKFNWQQQ